MWKWRMQFYYPASPKGGGIISSRPNLLDDLERKRLLSRLGRTRRVRVHFPPFSRAPIPHSTELCHAEKRILRTQNKP